MLGRTTAQQQEDLARRGFETNLSRFVLENAEFVAPAVRIISQNVLKLLLVNYCHNKKASAAASVGGEAISKPSQYLQGLEASINFLFEEHNFGRMPNTSKKPSTSSAHCMLLVNILTNTQSPIPLILNTHAQFFQNIFPHCQIKHIQSDANSSINTVRVLMGHVARAYCHQPNLQERLRGYFRLYPDRGRIQSQTKPIEADYVNSVGILYKHTPEFTDMVGYFSQLHLRAMECFQPDLESPYVEAIQNTGLPFVSGPSGHSNCLLRLALMVGSFDRELMQQYTLAVATYLVSGGMHSYHEVMIMANHLGLPYDPNNYLVSLPQLLQANEKFAQLKQQHDKLQTVMPRSLRRK